MCGTAYLSHCGCSAFVAHAFISAASGLASDFFSTRAFSTCGTSLLCALATGVAVTAARITPRPRIMARMFVPPFRRLLILLQDFHQIVRGFLGVHDGKLGHGGSLVVGIFLPAGDGHNGPVVPLKKIRVEQLFLVSAVAVFRAKGMQRLVRFIEL